MLWSPPTFPETVPCDPSPFEAKPMDNENFDVVFGKDSLIPRKQINSITNNFFIINDPLISPSTILYVLKLKKGHEIWKKNPRKSAASAKSRAITFSG